MFSSMEGGGEEEREKGGERDLFVISIRYTLIKYMNHIVTKDGLHMSTLMSKEQTKALLHYIIQ